MPSERIEFSGSLKYVGVSAYQSNKFQPTGWEPLFKPVIGGKRRVLEGDDEDFRPFAFVLCRLLFVDVMCWAWILFLLRATETPYFICMDSEAAEVHSQGECQYRSHQEAVPVSP